MTSLPTSSNLPTTNHPTPGHRHKKKDSETKDHSTRHQEDLKWNPAQQVIETLEKFAEQADVQSAVIMARVLGDRVQIDKTKLKHWTISYIGSYFPPI